MAILDHVEQISVCFVLKGLPLVEGADCELPINRYFAFAIAVVPVAHPAIVPVIFLPLSDRLNSWLSRIDLMDSLGRNTERFWRRSFRRGLAFLCCRREYAKQQHHHKNAKRLQHGAPRAKRLTTLFDSTASLNPAYSERYRSTRQPACEWQACSGSAEWNHEVPQCAACENWRAYG